MKLSQTSIMAIAGGAIAGISYLAGRKEGIEIGKTMGHQISEQIGYLKALKDFADIANGKK